MSDAIPRVFVVDDDGDLAASLARMFRRHGWQSEAFSDPGRFIASYAPDGPACAVIDMYMGAIDGFAAADRLRAADPSLGLVFMTAWPETKHAIAAVRHRGGFDYLDKPLDEIRLHQAVTDALAWSTKRNAAEARLAALSARERQVFDLLAAGLTNKAVAARLNLAEKTIEDHRSRVMAKIRARSLADIIAAARALE